jgi:hypothetical protein
MATLAADAALSGAPESLRWRQRGDGLLRVVATIDGIPVGGGGVFRENVRKIGLVFLG